MRNLSIKFSKSVIAIIVCFCLISIISCKKSSFLDESPNKQLIIPTTIADFQAILDDYYTVNVSVPDLPEVRSDDYYWLSGYIMGGTPEQIKTYTWQDDIGLQANAYSWNYPYNIIFKANIVLEGLDDFKYEAREMRAFENLRGGALFIRAFYYYQLLQLFAPAYSDDEQNSPYGIPLRIKADINEKIFRATLKDSYTRVIDDLKIAANLLSEKQDIVTRPQKASAYALLARTYLSMNMFDSSLKYANNAIVLQNKLLNYNSELPERLNKEVIWSGVMIGSTLPTYAYAYTSVDSNLVNSYRDGDLRRTAFYDVNPLGGYYFKGSYGGASELFAGLSVNEIYITKAECLARLGNVGEALATLNTLIETRWKSDGSWAPFNAATSEEAIKLILEERRKELPFRCVRWADLKRLNYLGANIDIIRKLDDGSLVTLKSNSPRFTVLIPQEVIGFNPHMRQNPR